MTTEPPSDIIARLLAEMDSAADDRELIQRVDAVLSDDDELWAEFLRAAMASGHYDRWCQAQKRVVDRALKEIAETPEETKLEWERQSNLAFAVFLGELLDEGIRRALAGPRNDDPIDMAEHDMADHEVGSLRKLHNDFAYSLFPREVPSTELEMDAAMRRWLEEDPAARQLAERLSSFRLFRQPPPDEMTS